MIIMDKSLWHDSALEIQIVMSKIGKLQHAQNFLYWCESTYLFTHRGKLYIVLHVWLRVSPLKSIHVMKNFYFGCAYYKTLNRDKPWGKNEKSSMNNN